MQNLNFRILEYFKLGQEYSSRNVNLSRYYFFIGYKIYFKRKNRRVSLKFYDYKFCKKCFLILTNCSHTCLKKFNKKLDI